MVKNILISIKTMWKFARIEMCFKLFEVVFISIMTPLSLLFTQNLINGVVSYFNSNGGLAPIILWSILLIVSMFLVSSTGFINNLQNINMKRKLDGNFTQSIIEKYRRIDFACFEDASVQDTLSRMGNSPQDLILNTFLDFMSGLSNFISIVGILLIFSQVSWILSAVFVVIIPLMIWFDYKAMDIMNDMFNNQTEDERWLSYYGGLLSEKNSLLELKVFSAANYIANLWRIKNKKVLTDRLKTTLRSQRYSFASMMLILCWVAILLYTIVRGVSLSIVSLGLFVSLVGSAEGLLGFSEQLSYTFSNLARHYLQVQHYNTFIQLPEIPRCEKDVYLSEGEYEIEFYNVHFHYPGIDNEILKGVSFKISSNEKISIVGENGSGKSTIIKLLCRLYRPDSGWIKVNGRDISDLSESQLHAMLCVVFQDYCCYNLSLRENVALSNIERIADDLMINQALKEAKSDVISNNLDIPLGKIEDEGIDVSGGQWQRIAIARALFSNSNFVVLDEPTASLDPLAESEMYHAFANILHNRGCIMISHRLASAKMADRIIVIKDGIVSEMGTHSQLIDTNGLYSQMWRAQSEWYTEENKS